MLENFLSTVLTPHSDVTVTSVLPVDRVRKIYENKTSKQNLIIAEFNTFLISKCEKTLSQAAVMVPLFVDVNVV